MRPLLDNCNLLLFEQEKEEDMQLATTYFSYLMCYILGLAFISETKLHMSFSDSCHGYICESSPVSMYIVFYIYAMYVCDGVDIVIFCKCCVILRVEILADLTV